MNDETESSARMLDMTVGIVANYVAANKLEAEALPALIQSIHASLAGLGAPVVSPQDSKPERLTPAQIRKLITPSGIISLINQKPFKSMKRHITTNGYTPTTYREHFGLPADFPMVHPDYAQARSQLAKATGLGQGGRKPKGPGRPGRKAKPAT